MKNRGNLSEVAVNPTSGTFLNPSYPSPTRDELTCWCICNIFDC
jgi:hypothetical protein